ncbi:hypothetical protein N7475_007513 [Penicillium sp. IBT 31633x]|nr:hypothetical protein N7475_007513 [Penicillium sp. IBT 31633x]
MPNDNSTHLDPRSENAAVTVESAYSMSDGIIVASPSSWLDPSWELSFNDHADSDHQVIDGLPDISTPLPREVAENGFPESETLNIGIDAPDPNWIRSPPTAMATNTDPFFHSNTNTHPHLNQGLNQAPNQKRKSMSQPRTSSPVSSVPLFGASKYSPGCQCLSTMARFLETMGLYEPAGAGIDTLLSCLGRGIVTCEDVLACPNCNACADNSMLLSTLILQLGIASKNMADLLVARVCNKSDPGTVTGETMIWFGGYRIEMPNLRLRLVYNVILLHFTHLRGLFARIKDGVRPDSVAWRRIISTEDKVGSVFATIKRQLQREEWGW